MQLERQTNWSMFRVGQLDSHSDINRLLVNDKFIEMVIPILMIFDPSLIVSFGSVLFLFYTFVHNVLFFYFAAMVSCNGKGDLQIR